MTSYRQEYFAICKFSIATGVHGTVDLLLVAVVVVVVVVGGGVVVVFLNWGKKSNWSNEHLN